MRRTFMRLVPQRNIPGGFLCRLRKNETSQIDTLCDSGQKCQPGKSEGGNSQDDLGR